MDSTENKLTDQTLSIWQGLKKKEEEEVERQERLGSYKVWEPDDLEV